METEQKSIGRWFKSGSKEEIFLFNKNSLKLVGSAFDKKGTQSWLRSQQMLPVMNLRQMKFGTQQHWPILDSLVVRIPACHAGGRGSIPRRGENYFAPVVYTKLVPSLYILLTRPFQLYNPTNGRGDK